jgi:hypothetical protein
MRDIIFCTRDTSTSKREIRNVKNEIEVRSRMFIEIGIELIGVLTNVKINAKVKRKSVYIYITYQIILYQFISQVLCWRYLFALTRTRPRTSLRHIASLMQNRNIELKIIYERPEPTKLSNNQNKTLLTRRFILVIKNRTSSFRREISFIPVILNRAPSVHSGIPANPRFHFT